ncbi:hypothetical protein GPECTOR_5g437 [Gonium pectorale]|uniref:Uncharacterized protein n=1 Tax=Gonium pectorale TaxID=33097 RepID=A0A150GWT2_GONPE|nr:hypothetical protein GPECTOR_5g437 [Gonium pectorale]|eukprot:KXZ54356.1 hypothetical protein GPECTOR_5g437 [Gonium pectorale]
MCRLPPPALLAAAAGVGGEGVARTWEEAEAEEAAYAAFAGGTSSAMPLSARACCWMPGTLQHCIFDGPTPRVHVLLGPDRLPYTLPYEYVVPVSDAAEGSGSAPAQADGGGLGGGSTNTCMDIVPVL